jgi:hypothetical protein
MDGGIHAVDSWLQVHRRLLQQESAFTDLALRAAKGEVPLETLAAERAALMELRNECVAAYEKAFPAGQRA